MNTNDIIIRKAENDDIEAVETLLSTYFLDMDGVDIKDFIVAESGGRVLGCGAVIDQKYPELHSIAVHPNHRSRGIGALLVEHIVANALDEWGHLYVRTTAPDFFNHVGFIKLQDSEKIKLWNDCAKCDKFEGCRQSAMRLYLKE
ncbi:MAG: GNAT family N-acetyltransferase [Methanosarcinaceae archaeon]|nr:GNAT family N-acetyltransferase [Methanosarcinaceae archaeon]